MANITKGILKTLFLIFCGYILCLCFNFMTITHNLNIGQTFFYQYIKGQDYVNISVNISVNKIQNEKTESLISRLCLNIMAGNESEWEHVANISNYYPRREILEDVYPRYTKDCSLYRKHSGFIMNSVSKEEEEFPIAFSILIFKHVEQFERLLRAVYRPHNVYCVHVDNKTSHTFQTAVKSIVECLPNVFIISKMLDVQWGTFSVLEPELICMDSLLKHKVKWKYFINLTGQEYPLKTNYELVKILKSYKGANDIQGTYKGVHSYRWTNKKPVPHGIKLRKGGVHIAASRAYVNYVTTNQTALDFLEWTKPTVVPDETYFSSLNYNPHLMAPGSYKGDVDDGKRKFFTRYKLWSLDKDKCHGKFVRWVCVFGEGDIQYMITAPHLFANKFHFDYEPLALECLQEWYFDKVAAERNGHIAFDLSIYENRFNKNNSFI